MLLIATILALVSVAGYLISVGGRLKEAKISDEAFKDIQKVYKLEVKEDEATRERLDGGADSLDSISSIFPSKLRPVNKKSGVAKNLQSTAITKD